MRLFASILTVLVLLLTAAPNLAHAKEIKKEHSCCKTKKTAKKDHDCCSQNCNPFLSCCGGMGFILSKSDVQLQTLKLAKENNEYRYVAMHSNFFNDMWQPPKIQC
jgi:hypothetical protein